MEENDTLEDENTQGQIPDNNQEDTSRDHAGSQYNKKQPDLCK